jgi:hypothetical protein
VHHVDSSERQRQNWAAFGLGVAALAGVVVAGVPAASLAHAVAAKVAVVSPLSGPAGYADRAGDTTGCLAPSPPARNVEA